MNSRKSHRPMVHAAPALILAVSLVVGCLAGQFSHDKHRTELSVSAALVSIAVLIHPSPLALGAAGFLSGMALENLKSTVSKRPPGFGDQAYSLKGKVVKVRPSRYGQNVLTVRISETLGRKRSSVNFLLSLNVPGGEGILRGDEIVFRSSLRGIQARSGASFIRGSGIEGSWVYGRGCPSLVHRARGRLKEALGRLPPGPASSLLAAISLGERWRVDTGTRDVMRKTGTYHLMAISGVHIGSAILPFLMILRFAATASQRVRPRRARFWLLIMSLLAAGTYLCFTGHSASALRAAVYLLLAGAALIAGRSSLSLASLSWCVIAIILFSSHPQPDISLVLSALAVAGIISGSRGVKEQEGYLKGAVKMTLGAFLFTMPVVVWLARGVSVVTVPGNLAAGLFFGLFLIPAAVLIDLAALIPQFPLEPMAEMWIMAAEPVLGAMAYLADLPFSFLILSAVGCLAASLAAFTGILVWRRRIYSTGSGIVIFLAVIALSGSAQFLHNVYDRDRLIISFPAVGQADAAIIRQNGRTILMDCGPPGLPGRDSPVTRSLRELGVRKISAVYLSHLHPDHAGGLREILALWPVQAIYLPKEQSREFLQDLMPEGKPSAVQARILKYGDVIDQQPFSFRVLGPHPSENRENDRNRGSLQILMETGGFHALFTGDAGWDQVVRVLESVTKVDVLKIPHHGSKAGFPPPGLEAAVARSNEGAGFMAVCPSHPPGNRHLPADVVVRWFAEKGIELVYTGENGVTIEYK